MDFIGKVHEKHEISIGDLVMANGSDLRMVIETTDSKYTIIATSGVSYTNLAFDEISKLIKYFDLKLVEKNKNLILSSK